MPSLQSALFFTYPTLHFSSVILVWVSAASCVKQCRMRGVSTLHVRPGERGSCDSEVPIVQNVGRAMCMAGRPGRSGGGSSTGQASATNRIRRKNFHQHHLCEIMSAWVKFLSARRVQCTLCMSGGRFVKARNPRQTNQKERYCQHYNFLLSATFPHGYFCCEICDILQLCSKGRASATDRTGEKAQLWVRGWE